MDQKTLKQIEEIIKKAVSNLVTKDDAKNFATKHDLRDFATKDDLKNMKRELIEEIRDVEINVTVSADKNKAEKADLERLERRVDKIEQKLAQ